MQKNPGLEGFIHRKMILDLFQKIKKEVIWRIERFSKDTAYPIKPEKLVVDVRNTLDQDDIVISDVGAHKLWIAKVYNTYFQIHVLSQMVFVRWDLHFLVLLPRNL